MTDAEISRRLALAIGWDKFNIEVYGSVVTVWPWSASGGKWKRFDYRDPAVIWPIAERFDCFPWKALGEWWSFVMPEGRRVNADAAAKAVALAVIKAQEQEWTPKN